jgi:hypothetical protein
MESLWLLLPVPVDRIEDRAQLIKCSFIEVEREPLMGSSTISLCFIWPNHSILPRTYYLLRRVLLYPKAHQQTCTSIQQVVLVTLWSDGIDKRLSTPRTEMIQNVQGGSAIHSFSSVSVCILIVQVRTLHVPSIQHGLICLLYLLDARTCEWISALTDIHFYCSDS